ncbi:MAG: PEGA domain-containing protein [Calditrichaeota bacterium]|nr:PEGA domain-containing protein [Calditrichota bacterium]
MDKKKFIGKVFGHFRILEPLGQGGMGLVFKALNTHLDIIVALKMIAPGLSLNQKLLNRFKTEARALARLENPHIVRISDLQEAEGHWFIVMEYVEGDTLSDWLKDKHPLPLKDVFDITAQILSALQHAHSASIIHRDIKPSNILITTGGVVKVTDFGLAKIQENSLIHTQLSAVGGTLYYMSPEQVKSLKETDHRTDIYSLGITLYQMVTGRVPFNPHQTDFDIRETIVRKPFAKPSTYNPYLPPDIDELVMKAIAKNPDERFQSAYEMLQEMERIKEKLGDKLNKAFPLPENIEDEINFSDYPFEIKNDFSGESEVPSIPVEPQNEDRQNGTSQKPAPSASSENEASEISQIPEFIKRKKFWLISLIPVVIIFVIALIMMNRSKEKPPPQVATVTVFSKPAGAAVYVNSKEIGKTPLDSFSVSPGKIHLQLQKAGYDPVDTSFVINAGIKMVFNLPLTKTREKKKIAEKPPAKKPKPEVIAPVSLTFKSQPNSAKIFINNKFFGQTPVRDSFKPDRQLFLRIEKEGYLPALDTLLVSERGKRTFNFVLIPRPVPVIVTSKPSSVSVYVDGRKKGVTEKSKLRLALSQGKHVLRFTKSGYKEKEQTIRVEPGKPQNLSVVLEPLTGFLEIHVLPWGNIFIDGELKKKETDVKERFELQAGAHRVKIQNPAFTELEQSVTVAADKTTRLVFDFNKTAEVRVLAFDKQNNAQYARIWVDNKPTERYTPGAVYLTLGKHLLTVEKEGYKVVGGAKTIMVLPSAKISPVKFYLEQIP